MSQFKRKHPGDSVLPGHASGEGGANAGALDCKMLLLNTLNQPTETAATAAAAAAAAVVSLAPTPVATSVPLLGHAGNKRHKGEVASAQSAEATEGVDESLSQGVAAPLAASLAAPRVQVPAASAAMAGIAPVISDSVLQAAQVAVDAARSLVTSPPVGHAAVHGSSNSSDSSDSNSNSNNRDNSSNSNSSGSDAPSSATHNGRLVTGYRRSGITVPKSRDHWIVVGVFLASRDFPTLPFWLPLVHPGTTKRLDLAVPFKTIMATLSPTYNERDKILLHVRVAQRVDRCGKKLTGEVRYLCTDIGVSLGMGDNAFKWISFQSAHTHTPAPAPAPAPPRFLYPPINLIDHSPTIFQVCCGTWNSSLNRAELEDHLVLASNTRGGMVCQSAEAEPARIFFRTILQGKALRASCQLRQPPSYSHNQASAEPPDAQTAQMASTAAAAALGGRHAKADLAALPTSNLALQTLLGAADLFSEALRSVGPLWFHQHTDGAAQAAAAPTTAAAAAAEPDAAAAVVAAGAGAATTTSSIDLQRVTRLKDAYERARLQSDILLYVQISSVAIQATATTPEIPSVVLYNQPRLGRAAPTPTLAPSFTPALTHTATAMAASAAAAASADMAAAAPQPSQIEAVKQIKRKLKLKLKPQSRPAKKVKQTGETAGFSGTLLLLGAAAAPSNQRESPAQLPASALRTPTPTPFANDRQSARTPSVPVSTLATSPGLSALAAVIELGSDVAQLEYAVAAGDADWNSESQAKDAERACAGTQSPPLPLSPAACSVAVLPSVSSAAHVSASSASSDKFIIMVTREELLEFQRFKAAQAVRTASASASAAAAPAVTALAAGTPAPTATLCLQPQSSV